MGDAAKQIRRSFVRGKQETARNLAASFVPKTALGIIWRDLATRLMVIPFLADAFIGRDLRDNIALPDYEGAVLS